MCDIFEWESLRTSDLGFSCSMMIRITKMFQKFADTLEVKDQGYNATSSICRVFADNLTNKKLS